MIEGIRMELMCVESTIENDIMHGAKQADVAQLYAMALVSSWPTDWKRVNAAISAKWPKGLNRVKQMAWSINRRYSRAAARNSEAPQQPTKEK